MVEMRMSKYRPMHLKELCLYTSLGQVLMQMRKFSYQEYCKRVNGPAHN